jgi:hypothetical protein
MENIGGTFPIGEVFTEAKDFAAVNGDALVFAYAKEDYFVQLVEPFRVSIAQGLLSAPEAPAEFQAVLAKIQADEGDVLVREFGLGLNPAFGKACLVNDITAFERQRGVHLSPLTSPILMSCHRAPIAPSKAQIVIVAPWVV